MTAPSGPARACTGTERPRSPGRRGHGRPEPAGVGLLGATPLGSPRAGVWAPRSPLPPPLPLQRHSPCRLHPAASTPSCLSARLAGRPTSCVVAISVRLLDILNPISLQKSPLLDLPPPPQPLPFHQPSPEGLSQTLSASNQGSALPTKTHRVGDPLHLSSWEPAQGTPSG